MWIEKERDEDIVQTEVKLRRRAMLGMAAASAGVLAGVNLAQATSVPSQSALTRLVAGSTYADPVGSDETFTTVSEGEPVTGPSIDRPIIVKWKYEELEFMYNPMSLTGGRIYLGQAGGLITVVNAVTGGTIWSESIGEFPQVSTPRVADGRIYFTTIERIGCTIQAVDGETGAELWRFTPSVADVSGVEVGNGVVYAGAEGVLFAFDGATGEIRWKTDPLSAGFGTDPVVYGEGVFVKNRDGYLIAVDIETGTQRWRSYVGEGRSVPLVTADRVFISGAQEFCAVNSHDGSLIWRKNLGDRSWHSSITRATIYSGSGNTFYALDTDTGEIRWRFSSGLENLFDSHVVASGIVYLSGESLYALSASDGSEYWRFPLDKTSFLDSTKITAGERHVFFTYGISNLYSIGNLDVPRISTDVILRGTPSPSGVERGTAGAGEEIDQIGTRYERDGTVWVEVTIGNASGWILFDSIDPVTLPPEGDIEYVYKPD